MAFSKLWFHDGAGGNSSGIGDAMRRLDAAGIPFFMMSASDAGVVYEAQLLALASGVPHRMLYRYANDGTDPYNYDVPLYDRLPRDAAGIHWPRHIAKWPAELDPAMVYIQIINECDKNRAEWLAEFEYYCCEWSLGQGRRYACFGWSSGEPEPEHWRGPWMLKLLRLVAEHPTQLAIALHEYSLDNDNLQTGSPHLIGRFQDLFAACDEHDIPHPAVFITEFGWGRDDVPPPDMAMRQLEWAAELYAKHPTVLGAAIWYLGGGYERICDKVQPLIAPLCEYNLKVRFPDPTPPPPEETLEEYLWRMSVAEQVERGLPLNVEAGLQRAIFADGMVPVHREIMSSYDDGAHIIQAAEDLDGVERRRVYEWLGNSTRWFNDPALPPPPAFALEWPTEYGVVTQPFGANPAYYGLFGLPGHEGVDLRAPMYSRIVACADGTVYLVHDGHGGHNYGIHVRIQHDRPDGRPYKTIYAHLYEARVQLGQRVAAGQLIGLADDTGNSYGSHLHLTLKHDRATALGETIYPYDIIDPTPFLKGYSPPAFKYPSWWSYRKPLVGVHGRADGNLQIPDFEAIDTANLNAVKLLGNCQPYNAANLLADGLLVVARISEDMRDRRVTPSEFVEWRLPDLLKLHAAGVRYWEIGNEPNLFDEGLGWSWANGLDFAAWWVSVRDKLAPSLPGSKFGFPGLSPGGFITNVRQDSGEFLRQAKHAVEAADWVGVHCYWQTPEEMVDRAHGRGYEMVHTLHPGKLLMVTEFSNPSVLVPKDDKAHQYVEYYAALPVYVGAAFCFVVSASNPYFAGECWRDEAGIPSSIPAIVGSR